MQTHEMESAVSSTTNLDSGGARSALRATLAVLGQRVAGEASDLAAQLPAELADAVPPDAEVEVFGLEEFYARVADLEGVEPDAARAHARAVTALLREAYPFQYEHLLAQLPDDWQDLTHADPASR